MTIVFLFSYPPKYIDKRFRNFFLKNSVAFHPLQLSSTILTENDFIQLRERLLVKKSITQTKRLKRIAQAHMTTTQREEASHLYKEKAKTRLILHHTYERRLRSIKYDIRKIWSESFAATHLANLRLIIGTRNRRNSKLELLENHTSLSLHQIQKQTARE